MTAGPWNKGGSSPGSGILNPGIPRCGRPTGGGDPCQWPAGRGTTHKNIGPCIYHERDEPFAIDRAVQDTREAYDEVERRQERLTRIVLEDGEDALMIPGSRAHKAWRELEAARTQLMTLASAALRYGVRPEEVPL